MSERILPEPDVYAVCPLEGPILPFYEGAFEAAFVLLSPFIRPISLPFERFHEEATYPSSEEICGQCEAARWSEVQDLSQLPSLAAVDVALRTSIGGLKTEFANKELASQLRASLDNNHLIEPSEGTFPELTRAQMLTFIQSLGHQWVWVGDEHCTERKLYWIEDLKLESASHPLLRSSVVFDS